MKSPVSTRASSHVLCLLLITSFGAYAQPSWTTGYPQLLSGASSVDLKLKIDSDGIIYYVLYSAAQNGITAAQLKNDALYGGNLSIVRRGNVAVTANTLQTVKQATL